MSAEAAVWKRNLAKLLYRERLGDPARAAPELTAEAEGDGAKEEPVGIVAAVGAFGGARGTWQEQLALLDGGARWQRRGLAPAPLHGGARSQRDTL